MVENDYASWCLSLNSCKSGPSRKALAKANSVAGSHYFLAKPQRAPRGSETVSLRALRLGERYSLLDVQIRLKRPITADSSQPSLQESGQSPLRQLPDPATVSLRPLCFPVPYCPSTVPLSLWGATVKIYPHAKKKLS